MGYDEKYAYKCVFPKKIGTARVDVKTQGTDHRCHEHHAVALAVVIGVNYVLQRHESKQCGLFMVVGWSKFVPDTGAPTVTLGKYKLL